MGSSIQDANGNHKDSSDLTQIRGIGAVRKRWLNALGIYTIADLAQASADTIDTQAKSDGRSLSRDELEAWIAQAQLHPLAVSLQQAEALPTVAAIAPVTNTNGLAAEQADPEGWNAIASFKVDYQTRQVGSTVEQRMIAQQLETGAIASWTAFEPALLQQWLHDHLEPDSPPIQTENAIATTPIVTEITQLRVMQPHYMAFPMVADSSSPIFPDAIQTNEPFALEVSMQFAGLSETNQEKQLACRVQCLARNLATGATDSVGEVTVSLALSNHSAYQVLLPLLRLHHPGTYRLKILATLQQAPAALGQFKVPMLHVV